MSEEAHRKRVWDIIERVPVAMLTTHFGDGLRARPVEPRPERAAGLIWIITDLRSGKEHEIEAEHDIGLTFVDEFGKRLPVAHSARRSPPRPRQGG